MRILEVIGARPNYPKVAAIMRAAENTTVQITTVSTGQHSGDLALDGILPKPVDYTLSISMGGSPLSQVSQITASIEHVIKSVEPDYVMVVGDVTSTLAGGVAALSMGVPLIHYEAGLRSSDLSMPEERNRIAVDHMSSVHYCTEVAGIKNLKAEGIHSGVLVGNVMIDTLVGYMESSRDLIKAPKIPYVYLTMHRPSNVDSPVKLQGILNILGTCGHNILWPIHPRSQAVIECHGLMVPDNITLLPPAAYGANLNLMLMASCIVTDSGGVSEEAAYLRQPCLVLRDTTERPSTVQCGSAVLLGADHDQIVSYLDIAMNRRWAPTTPIPMWDGYAADRIIKHMEGLSCKS